ncbi:hypothetical protein VOLCADRAFT_98972 [Volvox carteri f. nagariensis]|uniref:Uncharacterized protein n=1 Tax=Volvox carteri f. nagariensis TaxID=3068 RepID=D8UGQ8_VOLCA|nr:uncharacterized protein VOLCADRAFT_98972 [Volvox carteri f. nagariensis]EFJ41074.1 hypothetical protein VOLCADRAFT_98972 [Volvox carteri f. nagariensis]|eukprot:XP_002957837.1 hypothetical protein VOLCADRAFT_98972 [Volvox carteri f. nagariensis]
MTLAIKGVTRDAQIGICVVTRQSRELESKGRQRRSGGGKEGGPAMDQGQPSIPGGPGAEFGKAGPIYLHVRRQLMTRALALSGLEGKDGCHMAMHGPKRKEAASGSAARLSCQKASTFMVGASADNTAPTTTGGPAMDQGQPSIPGGPGAEFGKAGASSLQVRRQLMTRAMARSGLEGKDGCHMAMHGPKRKEAASGSAARLSCQKASTFMVGASADNTAPTTTELWDVVPISKPGTVTEGEVFKQCCHSRRYGEG